jgi:hypothetical protein
MRVHLDKRTLAVVAATAVLAACSDSTGTSGTQLSTAEKTALSAALTSSGALDDAGIAGGFGPIAITLLNSVGSLGTTASAQAVATGISAAVRGTRAATYQGAIGVQIIVTSGTQSATFTGVIGWDGLNSSAQTVDEVVAAGVVTATTAPVAIGTTPIGSGGGIASYWDRTTNSSYVGTSGSFVLTSASFSGSGTNCAQQGLTTCNYTAGTMNGSFAFGAIKTVGTGTYTQTSVTFNGLPTLKITIVE